MKFLNILLVLDSDGGNVLALDRAIQLARKENARLTVCDVVDSIPGDYGRLITSIALRELTDSIVDARLERIKSLLGTVGDRGISIESKVLIGKAHIEIARLVREGHYDLVIKPIAGRRVMRARSVSRECRKLLRQCPCPVWLVNVAELSDDGCIVAALDMPDDGAISTRLNEHILQVSRSIALAAFRPLHVVHAWTLTGEGHLRARGSAESDLEVDRMVAREAANRMAWLRNAVYTPRSESERIATDYLAPELHVVKGNASKVVPDLAQKLGAGLIVMGTAARSGLPGMLIGNTSEAVVFRSDSSLLIVKQPSSFSSPASTSEATLKPQSSKKGRAEPQFVSVPQPPATKWEGTFDNINQRRECGL